MRQEQIKLDALVDRYVRQHMFDDDSSVSDPTSATYREILDDVNTGKHPTAIRSVVKDVEKSLQYKSNSIMDSATTTSKTMRTWTAGSLLTSLVRGVQRRTGWTDAVATMALAGVFVVAGPSAFLLAGIMVGNISKRNMDQLFKKRYGDTYTVDATVKQEPLVEAPSDDEEDDDDENDNDDEENDDNKPKQK